MLYCTVISAGFRDTNQSIVYLQFTDISVLSKRFQLQKVSIILSECYVIKFTRFGIHPGVHIALAFTHGDVSLYVMNVL